MNKTLAVLILAIVVIQHNLMAQTLDLNNPSIRNYLRRSQLIEAESENMSFSISTYNIALLADSIIADYVIKQIYKSQNILLGLTPLEFNTDYNSKYLFGWNNGAMLSSRGIQNTLSMVSFFQLGSLYLSLKPKVLFVENQSFEGFPDSQPDEVWKV
ncbi:MAG: hypothetical protein RIC53_16660 [Cyclobacteriaceae bacterium]